MNNAELAKKAMNTTATLAAVSRYSAISPPLRIERPPRLAKQPETLGNA